MAAPKHFFVSSLRIRTAGCLAVFFLVAAVYEVSKEHSDYIEIAFETALLLYLSWGFMNRHRPTVSLSDSHVEAGSVFSVTGRRHIIPLDEVAAADQVTPRRIRLKKKDGATVDIPIGELSRKDRVRVVNEVRHRIG